MKRKVFISIAIILILIVLILFLTKFITINNFLKKVNQNFNITNFQYELVKNASTTHKYLKMNSTLLIIPNEDIKIFMTYNDNNSVEGLTIDEENKTVSRTIAQNPEYVTLSGNLKSNYSFIEKIKMCLNWKIDYEEINGIDCIVVTDENNNVTYYNK